MLHDYKSIVANNASVHINVVARARPTGEGQSGLDVLALNDITEEQVVSAIRLQRGGAACPSRNWRLFPQPSLSQ